MLRLFLISLFCLTPIFASAELLVFEDFDYADGALSGNSGGIGWDGTWSGGDSEVLNGTAVLQNSFLESAIRNTSVSVWGNDLDVAYMSAQIRTTDVAQLSVFGVGVTGPAWGGGINEGGFFLNDTSSVGVALPNVDYHLVFRLTRNDAGPDLAEMWVNPTSEFDPILVSTTDDYIAPGVSNLSFGQLLATTNTEMTIDNFRLGTTFQDVVPIPEPSSLLASLTLIPLLLRFRKQLKTAKSQLE